MTDKTARDALLALDVAIASATGSRVTLHLTRAKQLREALAAPAEGGQGEAKDPAGFSVAMVLDEANNWTARFTGKQMLLNYAAMLATPRAASAE